LFNPVCNVNTRRDIQKWLLTQFNDGFSYSKGKLDAAYISLVEKQPLKQPPSKEAASLKKDDIDLVVRVINTIGLKPPVTFIAYPCKQAHEFELTRAEAEKALLENDKDVIKTLKALVTVRSG
jgi:NACalpha-BTF3-like transcription factor